MERQVKGAMQKVLSGLVLCFRNKPSHNCINHLSYLFIIAHSHSLIHTLGLNCTRVQAM